MSRRGTVCQPNACPRIQSYLRYLKRGIVGRALERRALAPRPAATSAPARSCAASAKSFSVMPFGGVVHQLHGHEGIRHREVRMVPGRLGQVANGVHHHQRALPAAGLVLAAYPPVFEVPLGQLFLEPGLDLFRLRRPRPLTSCAIASCHAPVVARLRASARCHAGRRDASARACAGVEPARAWRVRP